MHRQFLRLFFSILSITILVLALQLVFFLIFDHYLAEKWKENIFQEVIKTMRESIEEVWEAGYEGAGTLFINAQNERVSGVIFRDAEGKATFSTGSSPRGIPVKQIAPVSVTYENKWRPFMNSRLAVSSDTSEHGAIKSIKRPEYILSLETKKNLYGLDIPIDLTLEASGYKGETEVPYPANIDSDDIAGSIEVRVNGELEGYIDIIVFSIDYYGPTSYLMRSFFICIAITFALSIVIALVGAWIISHRSSRHVREVQRALEKIRRGEGNISFHKTRIKEFQAIDAAIIALGEDLERHRESRKEWIRNISHDLNTPLTAMNVLIECAEAGVYPIDERLLYEISKELSVLKERIASVAYYATLLSPDTKVEITEIPVSSLVDAAINRLDGSFDIKLKDGSILGDYDLSLRALSEVVSNAVTYKSDDAPVQITSEESDKGIIIRVMNHGTLPHPEPNFFEPWSRGEEGRSAGGSGMGLSIVHQTMKIEGGAVTISERDGVVRVTLFFRKA